jgi:phosphatidylserine decarboxylase
MAAVFYTTGVRTREFAAQKESALLRGRRYSMVAREGVPLLVAAIAAIALSWYYFGWIAAILPALILGALYYLFRDPRRAVPSVPLAVVSPVDGVVTDITVVDQAVTKNAAHKIIIRINSLGTYTARSPVEGLILDYRSRMARERPDTERPGLWVRTDEGDDVVLRFHGHRFGLVPRAFSRYGERVGQGQRCAYLRLTRFAEIYLPINSRILVAAGRDVVAGSDVLGTLPHPQ